MISPNKTQVNQLWVIYVKFNSLKLFWKDELDRLKADSVFN